MEYNEGSLSHGGQHKIFNTIDNMLTEAVSKTRTALDVPAVSWNRSRINFQNGGGKSVFEWAFAMPGDNGDWHRIVEEDWE